MEQGGRTAGAPHVVWGAASLLGALLSCASCQGEESSPYAQASHEVELAQAWERARTSGRSADLPTAARAFRGARARRIGAGAFPTDEAAFEAWTEVDGLLLRELARRRRSTALEPHLVRETRSAMAAWTQQLVTNPRQRIVDYREPAFRVEVPPAPAHDYRDAVTLSLWLALDADVAIDETKIVSHAGVSGGKLALLLDSGNRPAVVAHLEGGSTVRAVWNARIEVGRWTHVALSYRRGSGVSLHVDGRRLVAPAIWPRDSPSVAIAAAPLQELYIGGLDRVLPGRIDDVRLYERALGDEEIEALAGGEPVDGGLVGHWPFDELIDGSTPNAIAAGPAGRVGSGVQHRVAGAPALGRGSALAFARDPRGWAEELDRLRTRLDSLEQRALGTPGPPEVPSSTDGLLAELRRRGAILVAYAEDPIEDRLYAWRLDSHARPPVKRVDLGRLSEATADIAPLVALGGDEREWRASARRVARRLWDPLEQLVGANGEVWLRLDAALHGLPFAALVDESGEYLVRRYAFARVGPVAGIGTGPVSTELAPLVAFGDPGFGAYPDPKKQAGPRMRSAGTRTCILSSRELPGSGTEARRIAQLFGERTSRSVQLLLGAEATESRLKDSAPEAGVLHIATHGYRLERDCLPEGDDTPLASSGLRLAWVDRARPETERFAEDGFLSAAELSNVSLDAAELVAFSGCATALGPALPGEGVLGLPAAAWISGAQASLATLWRVDDEAMTEEVLDFYDAWTRGSTPAEALRRAMARALDRTGAERGHTHPVHWAAIVLEGLR